MYIGKTRCLIIDNPGPDPGQSKSIAETNHQVGDSVRSGGEDGWVQPRVQLGLSYPFSNFGFFFPLVSAVITTLIVETREYGDS